MVLKLVLLFMSEMNDQDEDNNDDNRDDDGDGDGMALMNN